MSIRSFSREKHKLPFSRVTRSWMTCWGWGVWKCPRLRSHVSNCLDFAKGGGEHTICEGGWGNTEFAQKEGDFSDRLSLTVRCTHVDTRSCCRISDFQNFTFLLQQLSPAVEEHFKPRGRTSQPQRPVWGMWTVGERIFVVEWSCETLIRCVTD